MNIRGLSAGIQIENRLAHFLLPTDAYGRNPRYMLSANDAAAADGAKKERGFNLFRNTSSLKLRGVQRVADKLVSFSLVAL